MSQEFVSLANLAGGAAIERFDHELAKVLQNVADPNTTFKERSITLTVKVKPNDRRDDCEISIACASKLAAMKGYQSRIYLNERVPGRAFEADPRQMSLDFEAAQEEEKPGNAVPIRKAQNAD